MNQSRDHGTNVSEAADLVRELTGVLGFTLEAPPQKEDGLSDDAINDYIELRKIARTEKRWGDADAVRDQLDAAGISIADSGGETTWIRD
jgi:cysteinyl-tRNA synthetase